MLSGQPYKNQEMPELKIQLKELEPASKGSGDFKNENVHLNDPVILNPKVNTTYHIKTSALQPKALKVTFKGEYFPNFKLVDSTNGYGVLSSNLQTHTHMIGDNIGLFSKEILPKIYREDPTILPVLVMKIDDSCKMYELTNIEYTYDDAPNSTVVRYIYNHFIPALDLKYENATLQTIFQKQIPKIPVTVGVTPIFNDEKKPSYNQIKDIYDEFLQFNSKEKLSEQYKNTSAMCHLRAHFTNVLLATYGITSFKVFKTWNPNDWAKFEEHDRWDFHAAALIIDDKFNGWVWDAWVGSSQHLFPFKEWVIQKNEPLPIKVIIHHHYVINDYQNGKLNEGLHFNSIEADRDLETFKKLALSAAANLPGRPLFNKKFGFFAAKNDVISKDSKITFRSLPTKDNINDAIGNNLVVEVFKPIFLNEAFELCFVSGVDPKEIEEIIHEKFLLGASEKIEACTSSLGVCVMIPKSLENVFLMNLEGHLKSLKIQPAIKPTHESAALGVCPKHG